MKSRVTFASVACWLTFTVTGFSAQNLILNPGCETAGAPPPSWTQRSGSWSCTAYTEVPPQQGAAYFVAGYNPSAELWQDISVSDSATVIDWEKATAAFSGYIRSWPPPLPSTPVDLARIVVEYRNANTNVLASFDSGDLPSPGSWKFLADTRVIPKYTRTIRIRLISTRQDGSSNDGYSDGLSLTVTIPKLSCLKDADCRLQGCDDCSCFALASGDPLPSKCQTQSACIIDPCRDKVATCDKGKCVLAAGYYQ